MRLIARSVWTFGILTATFGFLAASADPGVRSPCPGVRVRKQGLSAAEAAKKVDLTKYRATVRQVQGPGIELNEMARIYDVMDGRVLPR
jgi:hypothetical protein